VIEVCADARPGHFRLQIDGHAPRQDGEVSLPCAAVSTIVQVVLAGLQVIERQYPEHVRVRIDYSSE